MTRIYTRSGDKGETSLFTGQRVPKNDTFIEALGCVDECNSAIGVAISLLPAENQYTDLQQKLIVIQHALFDLGAAIATPRTRAQEDKINKTRFDEEQIALLETWMDEIDEQLPALKTFILPGGHPAGAMLQLARSVCRRAERQVIPLNHHQDVSQKITRYLNRLSDYLFMASRWVNHLSDCPETTWRHD